MAELIPVDHDPFADSGRPKITVTPTQKAFLNSVAAGESPDYNTMYGGGRFEEMRDHPRQNIPIRLGPNAGKTSSAAGRYQFLGSTWDEAKNALNLPDFSPESQDAAATWLAERDYAKRTKGRNLWDDLEGAKGDPSKLNFIGGALSNTWTSLPGGIERNGATAGFGPRLASELSSQSRQPMQILPDAAQPQRASPQAQPRLVPVDHDPFAAQPAGPAPFADRFGGMDERPGMRGGMTRGAPTGVEQRMLIEHNNILQAANQGVAPNIDRHLPNFISDQVYEGDSGLPSYKDQNGKFVDIQADKHVLLHDPADGRLKVFARNPDNEENAAVGVARVLAPGLASGAPTARASIPVANAVKARIPSADELKSAAKEGFDAFRNSAAEVPAAQVKQLAGKIGAELNADGFLDVLAPKTFAVLQKLENGPDGSVMSAAQMHAFRRAVGKIAGSVDETERAAAMAVRERFDEFLGTIPETADTLKPALGNYAAAKRSEQVGGALERAKMQADSSGSGANIDNAMRQQFKGVLKSPKQTRGWNEEELAGARGVVGGDATTNAARYVGKLAPTGVVSGTLSGGAGFVAGGPAGAVGLPIVGYAGKVLADTLTAGKVQKLDELIRSRSPLAKQIESSVQDWTGKVNDLAEVPSAPKIAQAVLATRNLVNNLKDAGVNISPGEFIKALQGPMSGRAENEQPKPVGVVNQ
jgi:muramidase (phage lysozyme)